MTIDRQNTRALAATRMRQYWEGFYGGLDEQEVHFQLADLDDAVLIAWAGVNGDPLWVSQLIDLGVTPQEWVKWRQEVRAGCGEDVAWLVAEGWDAASARGLFAVIQGGQTAGSLAEDVEDAIGSPIDRTDFVRWLTSTAPRNARVTDPFGHERLWDLREVVAAGATGITALLAHTAGLTPAEVAAQPDALDPDKLRVLIALQGNEH